jgi:hypothetical protein
MPFLNEIKDEIVEAGKNYLVGKVFGDYDGEMIYPIHNRDDYKATVTFQPIKTEPADVGDFTLNVLIRFNIDGAGIDAADLWWNSDLPERFRSYIRTICSDAL